MGWPELTRYTAVAVLGFAVFSSAQAQITKCVDVQGNVTYTDAAQGNCRNGVVVDIASTAPAVQSLPAAGTASQATASRTALLMMTGSDAQPFAQTVWGSRPLPRLHASPDAATVGAAHDAVAATDRALTAMRTQKLLSSR